MSKFETHITFGIIVAIIYIVALLRGGDVGTDVSFKVMFALFTIPLFAIVCDIDQPSSKARTLFLSGGFIAIIILSLLNQRGLVIAVSILYVLLLLATKHRGKTHSIAFGVFISIPFIFYDLGYAVAAFGSYLTHYLLDRTTKNNKFPY